MLNPLNFLTKFIKSNNQKELDRIGKIVKKINILEESVKKLDDADFPEETAKFKEKIKNGMSLNEILPEAGIDLNLIQLIGSELRYPWMFERDGMEKLAGFADGIGPAKGLVISSESTTSNLEITPLVSRAHSAGLKVHPYTYRMDPGQLPSYASDFQELLRQHYFDAGVDGIFTDFPDKVVEFLEAN